MHLNDAERTVETSRSLDELYWWRTRLAALVNKADARIAEVEAEHERKAAEARAARR